MRGVKAGRVFALKTSLFALTALAAGLAACVQPARQVTPEELPVDNRPGAITIRSNPPGADIQALGRSLGPAPCSTRLPVTLSNGKWLLTQNVTIQALPARKEEIGQQKVLDIWTEVPRSIVFEMKSKPGPPVREDLDL